MRARAWTVAAVALTVTVSLGLLTPPALATSPRLPSTTTLPASGQFSFTTANGILPTWSSDDIVIVGVSPGSAVTSASNLTARVSMPIVAKTGSAHAAAGGFRFVNSRTNVSVRCSTPTIDTSAMLVDCVLPGLKNAALLSIKSIGSRARISGQSTFTWVYRSLVLTINGQAMADLLNAALDTSVFSPYVNVGTGDLVVTIDR